MAGFLLGGSSPGGSSPGGSSSAGTSSTTGTGSDAAAEDIAGVPFPALPAAGDAIDSDTDDDLQMFVSVPLGHGGFGAPPAPMVAAGEGYGIDVPAIAAGGGHASAVQGDRKYPGDVTYHFDPECWSDGRVNKKEPKPPTIKKYMAMLSDKKPWKTRLDVFISLGTRWPIMLARVMEQIADKKLQKLATAKAKKTKAKKTKATKTKKATAKSSIGKTCTHVDGEAATAGRHC